MSTTTTIASTGVPAVGASAAQSQAQATALLITDLHTAIAVAQEEGGAPGASVAQQAALQVFVTQATALILDLQAQLSSDQAPPLYVVQAGDTLPALAQAFLGDPLQFVRFRQVNGMHGLALVPGTTLKVPAPASASS